MRSGKNTEQFYGFFYVNICGALITAKKYNNICCRKKYWNFLRYFLRKYFRKYLWCLKCRKKYDNICCWKFFEIFLCISYVNICENICGALITAKNTIIFAVEKNTEIFTVFFTQILPKKYAEKISEIFTIANDTTILCGIFCNCKFYGFFFQRIYFSNFKAKINKKIIFSKILHNLLRMFIRAKIFPKIFA